MKMFRSAVFSVGVLCAMAQLPASATTWDATADYGPANTTNPNGVWSYGYDPAAQAGYQFKAFDLYIPSENGAAVWRDSTYISLGTPAFFRNNGSTTLNGVAPGQLGMHPGPVANDDAAVLRFTVPSAGVYGFSGQFFAGDQGETDVVVVLNGNRASPLLSLPSTTSNPVFAMNSLQLQAGDTLDFVLGNAGSYLFDTTPLALQVSSVPEPGTALLGALGLGVVLAGVRRRRR